MPHIDITMYPGRDRAAKAELADGIQRYVSEKLGVDSKYISVSIEDVAPEKWPEHIKSYRDEDMFVPPQV